MVERFWEIVDRQTCQVVCGFGVQMDGGLVSLHQAFTMFAHNPHAVVVQSTAQAKESHHLLLSERYCTPITLEVFFRSLGNSAFRFRTFPAQPSNDSKGSRSA
jgi:hypothetical protein